MRLAWMSLSVGWRYYSTVPPRLMGARMIRGRSRMRGKPPGIAKSLVEKIADHSALTAAVDTGAVASSADIGVPFTKKTYPRRELLSIAVQNKRDKELEQASRLNTLKIPLDGVKAEWYNELAPVHTRVQAEHYGIYRDLFEGAFFHPVTKLDVAYELDEDYVMPVYTGNKIAPLEAKMEPFVDYSAEENSRWTLIMTNPDTHLTDNNAEYLHWFVGNIPGSQVEEGQVLCNYLQPFPPAGTGFHRHIFVLFKQTKELDYSHLQRPENCTNLSERTFSTYDFYRQHQDQLTPMGLCFFQSEHDDSVRAVYHHVLGMPEPRFEYKHPVCYHPHQKMYPHKEPFDRYYDRYRDSKDIAEEVLKLKLAAEQPLKEPQPQQPYPLIHRSTSYVPSWLKQRRELMIRRREQFKDL